MEEPIKNHDVLVMATMSAGKSTLINALIGTELLPAMNEATTACHFDIRHENRKTLFYGSALSGNEKIYHEIPLSDRKLIRDWNSNRNIKKIELKGSFNGRTEYKSGLVFHDTPGPNNSQDKEHGAAAFGVAEKTAFDSFIYVINATQIGINDDRYFLEKILSDFSGKMKNPPIFVLNKADILDPEKGEAIGDCVRNVESYLVSTGFTNPVIVPCMAKVALCARKKLNGESMTRKQEWLLRHFIETMDGDTGKMIDVSVVPEDTRKKIGNKIKRKGMNDFFDFFRMGNKALRLNMAVATSGIRIIEELIVIQKEEVK